MPNLLSDLWRLYPYLSSVREFVDVGYDPRLQGSTRGYTQPGKVRISPSTKVSAIPNILGHELSHTAITRSPSWSRTLGMSRPSEFLSRPTELGPFSNKPGEYPESQAVEEAMVRNLFPTEFLPYWPGLDYRIAGTPERYFTPEQLGILSYLDKFLKYGYGAGSIEGPRMEGWGEVGP